MAIHTFKRTFGPKLMGGILLALIATNPVFAQSDTVIERDVARDPGVLADYIAGAPLPRPDIAPLLDNALIFTSINRRAMQVSCVARNSHGEAVGRLRVRVPPMGTRFFFASDIVAEQGFFGSVLCNSTGYVVGTQIMVGVVTTDLDVKQDLRDDSSTLLFTVAATK